MRKEQVSRCGRAGKATVKYRFLHIENQEVIFDPNLWALWPNRKAGLFGHPHPLDEWFMTLQFRTVNAFGTSEASRKLHGSLEQNQLLRFGERTGLQTAEVDTARQMASIQFSFILSRMHFFIDQCCYLSSQNVIHFE